MTVNELLAQLQVMSDHKHGDEVVKVRIYDPGVGPSPAVDIDHVQVGFDWNNGRILIYTTEPLVKKKRLQ